MALPGIDRPITPKRWKSSTEKVRPETSGKVEKQAEGETELSPWPAMALPHGQTSSVLVLSPAKGDRAPQSSVHRETLTPRRRTPEVAVVASCGPFGAGRVESKVVQRLAEVDHQETRTPGQNERIGTRGGNQWSLYLYLYL